MAIDWRLAETPDFLSTWVNAYGAGQKIGKERALQAGYQQYANDPQAGIAAVSAVDPERGLALKQSYQGDQDRASQSRVAQALASGDNKAALAAAGNLDPQMVVSIQNLIREGDQQKIATTQAHLEALGNIYLGIEQLSPDINVRLQAARQAAPQLGIDPAAITPDMLTDQALESHALGTKAYSEMLAQRHKDSTYNLSPGQHHFVDGKDVGSVPDRLPFGWRRDPETGEISIDPNYVSGSGKLAGARHVTGGGRGGKGAAGPSPAVPSGFVLD